MTPAGPTPLPSPTPSPETAVLLIDCPDQRGLVARVVTLLYSQGANILHADQHQDHELGQFFMRIEWTQDFSSAPAYSPVRAGLSPFARQFAALAGELKMRWQLHRSRRRPRVAIFCSQYLHCVADLLYRSSAGELPCEVVLIVSNHRDVEPLAAFHGVRFDYTPASAATRAAVEHLQLALLDELQIELVVLARYMQILTEAFVERYPAAIINVHHSFLPAFIGARPYHAAHARGVKLIGATSHYVTTVLDDGPIIEQEVARISHRDQVPDLIARGRDLERVVLARAVRWHLEHRILCYGNKTIVFD
jgi:formyltetrahydrofolate deformylase